jgi:hypothetical protein
MVGGGHVRLWPPSLYGKLPLHLGAGAPRRQRPPFLDLGSASGAAGVRLPRLPQSVRQAQGNAGDQAPQFPFLPMAIQNHSYIFYCGSPCRGPAIVREKKNMTNILR